MSDVLWTKVIEQAVQIERFSAAHQQLVAQSQEAFTNQNQRIEKLASDIAVLQAAMQNQSQDAEVSTAPRSVRR